MGLWMSRLLSLFGEKEARILVLGLDNVRLFNYKLAGRQTMA